MRTRVPGRPPRSSAATSPAPPWPSRPSRAATRKTTIPPCASAGSGLSAAPALDLLVAERLSLGATYRFRSFFMPSGAVTPGRQHEAYARVGLGVPIFGVSLHYALLYDQTDPSAPPPSHHA